MMNETYQDLADRINEWIGEDHTFSPTLVESLVWALAVDKKLGSDLHGAIAEEERELDVQHAELLLVHDAR